MRARFHRTSLTTMACVLLCLVGAAFSALAQPVSYQVEVNKGQLVRLPAAATTVAISNPDVADAQVLSPKMVYLSGKAVGETSILAIGASDEVVLDGTVEVTHNLGKLQASLQEIMPDADLQFSSSGNAIVLKGDVASPLMAQRAQQLASTYLKDKEQVVNLLNIRDGDQVMLKVKVAEVSRNELKRFGINLESILSAGNFVFGLANGRDIVNAATGVVNRTIEGDASLLAGLRTNNATVNTLIDALESDGLITVLAEPNLTTKSGVSANFLAGGEFPIPIVQGSGDDATVTVEYKKYGVGLDFTPTVLSKDKISLSVSPEVSTLSAAASIQANGFNIPSLLTRRASTTVELGSGESFAIAGLLRRDDSNDISKVPALGDLPILGTLFRSTAFQQDQTELVIIVTPYIVKGVAEANLATPLDGYRPAGDFERILLGKLYGETEAAPRPHALNGPAGFILR